MWTVYPKRSEIVNLKMTGQCSVVYDACAILFWHVLRKSYQNQFYLQEQGGGGEGGAYSFL